VTSCELLLISTPSHRVECITIGWVCSVFTLINDFLRLSCPSTLRRNIGEGSVSNRRLACRRNYLPSYGELSIALPLENDNMMLDPDARSG
jgi:hypothetical protein